jgi:glycoprotein-N-acetylgalactosamine 3-beta-galactosyltransferase
VPDTTNLAEYLYGKVRVLCFVMTDASGLSNQGSYLMDTWGKRCNKILFFSNKPSEDDGTGV